MVLNNDKWDKKAKRNYMIKHGIKLPSTNIKPRVRKHFVQNEFNQQHGSDDEEEEEEEFPVLREQLIHNGDLQEPETEDKSDGEEELEDEEEEEDFTNSNAWRYKDLPSEDEEDFLIEYNKLAARETQKLDSKKNINKIKSKDLLNLKIGQNKADKSNSHIRVLDEEDGKKFLELQEKANKQKHYHEMKLKFSDEQDNFKKLQKLNKILDLTDKDSYNDKVQAKLLQAHKLNKNSITDDQFDQDLHELVGIRHKVENDTNVDVEDLLNELDSMHLPRAQQKQTTTTTSSILLLPSKEDEDFLDDLL